MLHCLIDIQIPLIEFTSIWLTVKEFQKFLDAKDNNRTFFLREVLINWCMGHKKEVSVGDMIKWVDINEIVSEIKQRHKT